MHVLINIIKNAKDELLAKSVEKGWVKLTAGIDEKKVKFVIEDNGGGIPPENLLRVFEPYFSTKGENGTGLGLYMSDIIITKNFGGMIRAENTEAGACFTVEIPLK
jgi:C4-dicarboxylate-specific signal transduction histidine kinase